MTSNTPGKHRTRGPEEKAEQRKKIWEMYEQNVPVTEIAKRLRCFPSSVSANLRRQKEKRIRIQDYNKPTLRDQFAMAALTGVITRSATYFGIEKFNNFADWSYEIADAMMEARNAKD
jgi:hypothetical protein